MSSSTADLPWVRDPVELDSVISGPGRVEQILKTEIIEHLSDAPVDECVDDPALAILGPQTRLRLLDTVNDADRADGGLDDHSDGDLRGRLSQPVTTVPPRNAFDQSGSAQRRGQLLQVSVGDIGSVGNR